MSKKWRAILTVFAVVEATFVAVDVWLLVDDRRSPVPKVHSKGFGEFSFSEIVLPTPAQVRRWVRRIA